MLVCVCGRHAFGFNEILSVLASLVNCGSTRRDTHIDRRASNSKAWIMFGEIFQRNKSQFRRKYSEQIECKDQTIHLLSVSFLSRKRHEEVSVVKKCRWLDGVWIQCTLITCMASKTTAYEGMSVRLTANKLVFVIRKKFEE